MLQLIVLLGIYHHAFKGNDSDHSKRVSAARAAVSRLILVSNACDIKNINLVLCKLTLQSMTPYMQPSGKRKLGHKNQGIYAIELWIKSCL